MQLVRPQRQFTTSVPLNVRPLFRRRRPGVDLRLFRSPLCEVYSCLFFIYLFILLFRHISRLSVTDSSKLPPPWLSTRARNTLHAPCIHCQPTPFALRAPEARFVFTIFLFLYSPTRSLAAFLSPLYCSSVRTCLTFPLPSCLLVAHLTSVSNPYNSTFFFFSFFSFFRSRLGGATAATPCRQGSRQCHVRSSRRLERRFSSLQSPCAQPRAHASPLCFLLEE